MDSAVEKKNCRKKWRLEARFYAAKSEAARLHSRKWSDHVIRLLLALKLSRSRDKTILGISLHFCVSSSASTSLAGAYIPISPPAYNTLPPFYTLHETTLFSVDLALQVPSSPTRTCTTGAVHSVYTTRCLKIQEQLRRR